MAEEEPAQDGWGVVSRGAPKGLPATSAQRRGSDLNFGSRRKSVGGPYDDPMASSLFGLRKDSIIGTSYDDSHLSITQMKRKLDVASCPDLEIKKCVDRAQLSKLLHMWTDPKFKAATTIQTWYRERKSLQRLGLTMGDASKANLDKTLRTLAEGGYKLLEDVWSQMSVEEIDMYRNLFDEHDFNSSGTIDIEELKAITQTLQTELNWQQCHDLVKKCTFDQAKELDFEQFLRVVRESQRVYGSKGISMKKNAGAGLTPRKRAQYEHTFAKFDADGSGDIDSDELAEVLRSLGQKPSKEDVDEMIREAAADGEGTDATAITFDQFLNLMADPTRSFAQSFANQQAMMAKQLGSNIKVLKQWRYFASTMNMGLGRPRLLDNDSMWRVRAGTLPMRSVWVEREFTETIKGQSTRDDVTRVNKIRCQEVQVMLIESTNFPNFWVLPSGGQLLPTPENGRIDYTRKETPEQAATLHTASEAGLKGKLGACLGSIKDEWKHTITRWFPLEQVHEYGEDGEKHDFWEEPDRRRHWFPVLKEMIVTDGDQPPHGLRGTRYMAVGEAATKLLWRRPLHQALQGLVDGAISPCEPTILKVKKLWDGTPALPSHKAKAWMCIDSSSGALVIGTEATFHNDPRPRVRPGPMEGLDSPPYECVALYIATQADAGKTARATEELSYLQVIIGPHGHYLVQRLRGNGRVVASCLSAEQLISQDWYLEMLPKDREELRQDVIHFQAGISHDKTRWISSLVIPRAFVPREKLGGGGLCGNFYSISGEGSTRRYVAMSPVPSVTEATYREMHTGTGVDRLHPDMHAFTSFPTITLPYEKHINNWSEDNTASLAIGPKTVAKIAERLSEDDDDRRVIDAGWDTMGWYWDNLSRPANKAILRTPGYPDIVEKKSIFAWKDNSRPPTAIDIALNSKLDPSQFRLQETPRERVNPEPDSDPWQHPGATTPFKHLEQSPKVKKEAASTKGLPVFKGAGGAGGVSDFQADLGSTYMMKNTATFAGRMEMLEKEKSKLMDSSL